MTLTKQTVKVTPSMNKDYPTNISKLSIFSGAWRPRLASCAEASGTARLPKKLQIHVPFSYMAIGNNFVVESCKFLFLQSCSPNKYRPRVSGIAVVVCSLMFTLSG